MSEINRTQLIDALGHLSVMELRELVTTLEQTWGVSASSTPPGFYVDDSNYFRTLPEPEQTEFDVVMTSFGSNKIAVIKAIRGITNLGLKEAKDLVENAPAKVKEGVDRATADGVIAQLEEAGAEVELTQAHDALTVSP